MPAAEADSVGEARNETAAGASGGGAGVATAVIAPDPADGRTLVGEPSGMTRPWNRNHASKTAARDSTPKAKSPKPEIRLATLGGAELGSACVDEKPSANCPAKPLESLSTERS